MKTTIPGLLSAAVLAAAPAGAGGPPETVHVTYHVRAGKLDEFLAVLRRHYPAGRKLGIVLPEPHLILTGKEDGGKPFAIEVLTWRDGDAPDDVSTKYPDVQKIWDGLTALVEKREGKPGIEIEEVQPEPAVHAEN